MSLTAAVAGSINSQGLKVEEFICGNTSSDGLVLGDVVRFVTLTGFVDRAGSASTFSRLLGIVVGGKQTYNNIVQNDTAIGETAALVEESILVAWGGIVKVVAGGSFSIGFRLAPSVTTPGRVEGAVSGDFLLGNALGEATDPGDIVRVFLSISKVPLP